MNSIIFYVDEFDHVLKCMYYENYGSRKEIEIKLPDMRLHNIFFNFIKNSPKIEPINKGNFSIFSFNNVNKNAINRLIEESNNQKNNYRTAEITTQEKLNRKQNIKVKRTNKFNKKIAQVSASVLLTLSLFFVAKDCVDQIGFEDALNNLPSYEEIISKIDLGVDDIVSELSLYKDKIAEILFHKETKDENKNLPSNNNLENNDNTPTINNIFKSVEPQTIEEKKLENISMPDKYLRINTNDLVNGEKYNITKAYYSESLAKIAKTYGVDPALAMAIGIHERGIHSDKVDAGGAVGLFQIQVEGGWNWVNKTITAYNFETNQYEDVLITKESVSDVFENMKVGCMMLQKLLVTYDYNVAEAVTAYNYGTENVRLVLERCSNETGISIQDLNDINNIEWLKYRNIIKGGDPEYLENVFKYISDGTILSFSKPDQEIVNVEFDNLCKENSKTF